jgi:hypothetical protein
MKNLFITAMLMITSFVALSQSIELGTPNRFFPQNQEEPNFRPRPDKSQIHRERQWSPSGLPDSIYMKNGKIIIVFNTRKFQKNKK